MIQAGDQKIADMGATYRRATPDAGPAEVVDALMAAYCPAIAASSAPTYQKVAELRRFAMQAEAGASAQATAMPYPEIDVIWATPVGHTLVYRNPRPFAGKLACPANDGKLVPQDIVAAATALLGKPTLPIPGNSAGELATNFATQDPKAAPASLANALITAYCSAVIADTSVEQALQRAWVMDFGAQVIQALQSRSLASNKGVGRLRLGSRFRRVAAVGLGRFLAGMKIERHTIHAVALAGGLRTIVEDVAEMAAAAAAMHLGSGRKKAAVGFGVNRLIERRPEARPTRPAVEFGIRGEERLAATGTVVDAGAVLFVERARPGAFGPVLPQHPVLRGCQLLPPLILAQRNRE